MVRVLIPANIHLSQLAEKPGDVDRLAIPLHCIASRHLWFNENPEDYVNIHQDTIRNYLTWRHAKRIQTILLEQGIVETDRHYIPGEKSKGWRFGEGYRVGLTLHTLSDPLIIKKIIEWRQQDVKGQINIGLHKWIQRLRIDRDKAMDRSVRRMLRKDQSSITPYLYTVDELHDGHLWFIEDPRSHRRYTNATNLCKEVRGCLSIYGEPLVTIDLKNSQLFFLILLLDARDKGRGEKQRTPNPKLQHGDSLSCSAKEQREKVGERTPNPKLQHSDRVTYSEEKNRFKKLVLSGEVYDVLSRELTLRTGIKLSRGDFKVEFFKTVLYGNNHCKYASKSALSLIFQELFPHIWQFIVDSKPRASWKQFPVDMQRAESDFFIGTVARRLIQKHPLVPVITVHDAIMTTPGHVALVQRVLMEEFWKLGYQPTLSIEKNQ